MLHLWDLPLCDTNCNNNAASCESFYEFMALPESYFDKHRHPVHFTWEENSDLFADDEKPYVGDVLCLDYLGDYSMWIKVDKKDEPMVRAYLTDCHLNRKF